jgi:predicted nuclease of predicted toxin-antitoxin system
MPPEVIGILADANCEGHLALLLRLFEQDWRQEVWMSLRLAHVSFSDVGLPSDASDREVWEVCQREQVVLITSNRNDDGPDSLESTIAQLSTPQSLPVLTLANDQRVLRDRAYAERVADRLLEALFDMESYCGIGRLYLS